ncbi:MAG: helix-turn-helix transcriptional regulator [Bacilli bacterium]|nr:helix-turn-helix transcriptional regulator [Bacilli bacterium]
MNQEKIGKFISKCRKDKNITQEQLAEKLGVSNKSISRWENGKNMPDYSILKELCNILDIDVNEFLSGEKIENNEIQIHSIENLDLILKEYYKMKKQRNMFKSISIIIGIIIIVLIIAFSCIFIVMGGLNKDKVITDSNKYQEVIGVNSNNNYKNKWGMSEEIFPKTINKLDVKDFKMVYLDSWDKQYLSYLVVDYSKDEYEEEVERLNKYGIEKYTGYYGVTGFTNYKLLAMESDSYQGFVYAITDDNSRIIYVEMIFCNYFMDINYNKQIPHEYLPDGFDATKNNAYRNKMLKN